MTWRTVVSFIFGVVTGAFLIHQVAVHEMKRTHAEHMEHLEEDFNHLANYRCYPR